jgi:O-antigen ligase
MVADSVIDSGLTTVQRRCLIVLILVSVAVNLIYPGEVFFQSKFLLMIVCILTFLVTLIAEQRSGNWRATAKLVQIVFLPFIFLIPTIFLTINRSHTSDVLCLFFSYFCLFAVLQLLRPDSTTFLLSLLALCFVAFCVDLFCLHQYFVGLSDLRTFVLRSTTLDETLKSGVLTRIGTRRVFANFPLPNTLAGFVSMILPLSIFLLGPGLQDSAIESNKLTKRILRSRLTLSILVTQLGLSLVVLCLTQSFGGGLCACAALAVLAFWLIVRRKISFRLSLTILLVVSVTAAGWLLWVTHKRGFNVWNFAAPENPITLRWNNYKTAVKIFCDFPLNGVGLGNYGTINPRYQNSPKTVAQYAHNTILQLLSEAGVFSLASLLVLSVIAVVVFRAPGPANGSVEAERQPFLKVCLTASLAAWFIHNLLDIDFYFPSLGALGVFLMGMLATTRRLWGDNRKNSSVPKWTSGRSRLVLGLACGGSILASLLAVRTYVADSLCSLGIDYADAKDLERAERFTGRALAIQSDDASKIILQARFKYLNAHQKGQSPKDLLIGLRSAYEKATRLDPYNAIYQYELSRILLTLGEVELAAQSRSRAISLFPSEPKFRQDTPPAPQSIRSF